MPSCDSSVSEDPSESSAVRSARRRALFESLSTRPRILDLCFHRALSSMFRLDTAVVQLPAEHSRMACGVGSPAAPWSSCGLASSASPSPSSSSTPSVKMSDLASSITSCGPPASRIVPVAQLMPENARPAHEITPLPSPRATMPATTLKRVFSTEFRGTNSSTSQCWQPQMRPKRMKTMKKTLATTHAQKSQPPSATTSSGPPAERRQAVQPLVETSMNADEQPVIRDTAVAVLTPLRSCMPRALRATM
mmetsp:Transcript_10158/g.27622  ORF Transcript_10158/g.27622 Transcript_10158/m.27622 type:complete len:250 (-) Transcript_10158:558-1307(-)